MPSDRADPYVRIVGRITYAILILGPLGSIAAALLKGWRFGLGFLFGAALSYLSFWRWQRVVEALGPAAKPRATARLIVRFLGLAAIAYAIIKYLEVSPVAVFLGLLVSAAAVIVSIILELIYAGT
jgi:hypothetical protein